MPIRHAGEAEGGRILEHGPISQSAHSGARLNQQRGGSGARLTRQNGDSGARLTQQSGDSGARLNQQWGILEHG